MVFDLDRGLSDYAGRGADFAKDLQSGLSFLGKRSFFK
jgi:hypothetical protein